MGVTIFLELGGYMWIVLLGCLAFVQPMYNSLGNKALSLIEWDWQTALPEWAVTFNPGRPDRLGEATLDSPRITETTRINVWIRKNQTSIQIAGVIAHEFGHAFDWAHLNPAMREEWMKIRHLPKGTKWDPGCDCTDYMFGVGDWAESVAWTLVGPGAGFQKTIGKKPPNSAQQALIREWLGIDQPVSKR